jgi:hypothetical protein
MKRTLIVGAGALVLLGGCTTTTVYRNSVHPSYGQVEFDRDTYECRRENTHPAAEASGRVGLFPASSSAGMVVNEDMAKACLAARGWRQAPTSHAIPSTAQPNWTLWQRGAVWVNVANMPLPAWNQQGAGFSERAACDQARDAYLTRLAATTPDFRVVTLLRVERALQEGAVRFITTKLYSAQDGERLAVIILQFEALCRPAAQGPPTSEVSTPKSN